MASLQDWAQSGFEEDKAPARKFYLRARDLNDPMGCELREEPQRAGPSASGARLFRLGITMLF